MIISLVDSLRRRLQQALSVSDTADPKKTEHMDIHLSPNELRWRENFLSIFSASGSRANSNTLVRFARTGFPNALRGWAWCHILRVELVPG